MPNIIKGAIGLEILITVKDQDQAAVNLSSATLKNFVFRKPSLQTFTRVASFVGNGTDGKLTYTTVVGDLDEAGGWAIQVDLVIDAYTGKTAQAGFVVSEN